MSKITTAAVHCLEVAMSKARVGLDADLNVIKECFVNINDEIMPLEKTITIHVQHNDRVAQTLRRLEQEWYASQNVVKNDR